MFIIKSNEKLSFTQQFEYLRTFNLTGIFYYTVDNMNDVLGCIFIIIILVLESDKNSPRFLVAGSFSGGLCNEKVIYVFYIYLAWCKF